ncbi:MAG: hypothetical protein KJ070_07060 [Verrucomicrobia bacterium]|nr:hypothetical protein [Verrucomicrobiota bacterium]
MSDPFVIFWTVMVFTSVTWYGVLLFYVGAKGGREIRELTRALAGRKDGEETGREKKS